MSLKKKGRPVSQDPKRTMFRVRLDDSTLTKLDECAKVLETNRSEVVRKGIDAIHDRLPKK